MSSSKLFVFVFGSVYLPVPLWATMLALVVCPFFPLVVIGWLSAQTHTFPLHGIGIYISTAQLPFNANAPRLLCVMLCLCMSEWECQCEFDIFVVRKSFGFVQVANSGSLCVFVCSYVCRCVSVVCSWCLKITPLALQAFGVGIALFSILIQATPFLPNKFSFRRSERLSTFVSLCTHTRAHTK